VLILNSGTYFLADTHVNANPSAEEIAELAAMAAQTVRRFGVDPKMALLSHSNFGSGDTESARKMRRAVALLQEEFPGLEIDGEMHADAALDETIRSRLFPGGRLKGSANLLIMPNLDAANIAFTLLKVLGDGLPVGPILMGMAKPVHVVNNAITARGIVNMTALAVVDAQAEPEDGGRVR
jgi:malate dehydrogenase (oxaloacetate-decarboxylating)(NADP+)